MAKEEANKRWQDSMASFFETEGEHADKSFQVLKHVFYLP
jgi:L-rhamnose mutarotase